MLSEGKSAYDNCAQLFPLCRSLTGKGTLDTLLSIQSFLPSLNICHVASGYKAFDWTVPNEWNVYEAYIEDLSGQRVIDFSKHNLHVVGYSEPVNRVMAFHELDQHLYSLPDKPDAIPYVVSYYKQRWGFCLTHRQRMALAKLPDKEYKVVIRSTLQPGVLNYGEWVLAGDTDEEVVISTYVCHPSMANNELSGPAVAVELAKWLQNQPSRRYTYRILFLVETIGSLVYLSKNIDHMKAKVKAGFVLTCIGDNRDYSMIASRYGDNYADRIAHTVLTHHVPNYKHYSFLQNGSDERQFCAPGIDLPFCTLCRSKFAEYPEYHTSLDDLSLISPEGLQGGFDVVRKCIQLIEGNYVYQNVCLGEPQLGKRGLYPSLSTLETEGLIRNMMSFLSYADGTNDIIQISNITGISPEILMQEASKLLDANVVRIAAQK